MTPFELIALVAYWFFTLFQFVILADVILSWLTLLGIHVYITPIRRLLDPVYERIQHFLPTRFGMIDFTPIVAFFALELARHACVVLVPSISYFLL